MAGNGRHTNSTLRVFRGLVRTQNHGMRAGRTEPRGRRNPSPVQFCALTWAGSRARECPAALGTKVSSGLRAEGLSHCSELRGGGASIQSLSFFKCKKLRPQRGRGLLASCPCPLGALGSKRVLRTTKPKRHDLQADRYHSQAFAASRPPKRLKSEGSDPGLRSASSGPLPRGLWL